MIGQEIVQKVYEAQEKKEEEERVLHPRSTNYTHASELGWVEDCPRHLCLRRLCPEKAKGMNVEFKRRLAEGKKQEDLIRGDLTLAGYTLNRRGLLTWPKLQLTGEIDDEIVVDGESIPVDYKTASSQMFKHISRAQCQADLRRSPFIWLRHYPSQLQAYLLMLHKGLGILFFKDKEGASYHTIDIPFDSSYSAFLLEGLTYVNRCVESEDPPAAEKKEACDACGFADYDFPERERDAGGQLEVVTEETWLMKLKEYQMMLDQGVAKAAKDFDKLDKEIKEEFRGRRVLVGAHLVESKAYFTTFFDIPADEKAKYQKQREQFRTSIKLVAGAL